jgi:hypothetical protein
MTSSPQAIESMTIARHENICGKLKIVLDCLGAVKYNEPVR